MNRPQGWGQGFEAGVLACLTVIRHYDGDASQHYVEVAKACGPIGSLIRAAKRDGQDEEVKALRELARDIRERRRT
jgi:hypothetical protein